jgi:apolipoprotein D and lipocalin family protein
MTKSHTMYTDCTPGVHRRAAAWALGLVALLAACGAPAPEVATPFRDPKAAFGGTTRFEVGRFAGDWHTVACLGACDIKQSFVVATDGVFVRRTERGDTPYLVSAPGVLRQMGGDATLVVMWVDDGFRTAAIGDADGRWSAVIDRSAKPGADRLAAAVEILDFNGWDVTRLKRTR